MALVRWNPTMPWRPSQESWSPFTGMESLRAEMDHLFNSFLGTMPPSGAQESLWYPRSTCKSTTRNSSWWRMAGRYQYYR